MAAWSHGLRRSIWEGSRLIARALLALYSVAMALVLVYSAEHYVVDILIGWLYVIVTAWMMQRLWPPDSPARNGAQA